MVGLNHRMTSKQVSGISIAIRISCIIGIAFMAYSTQLYAQILEPSVPIHQYQYENWTTDDGLPQNSVLDIVQTHDGYLWIGTYSGVARFDGVRFKVYSMSTDSLLLDNAAVDIYEDSLQNIFVAFRGGGLVRISRGTIDRIWTTSDGLLSNIVWCVSEDNDGVIWVGTDEGINHLRGDSLSVAPGCESLNGTAVRLIHVDENNVVWVGTETAGLGRYSNKHLAFLTEVDGLVDSRIKALCPAPSGGMWIGTENGLNYLKGEIVQSFTMEDGLLYDEIRALFVDSNNALWVGSYGAKGGINRYYDGVFSSFTPADGLTNSYIRSITEDREGSLWFGTNYGLNRLKQSKFTSFTTIDGLGADFTRVVIEDSHGDIWVGTDLGGVSKISDGPIVTLTEADGLLGNSARSLCVDSEGALWIGVFGGGLNRVTDQRIESYTESDGLPSNLIRSLYEDSKGNLWIGTEDAGISILSQGEFRRFDEGEGFIGPDVAAILEDGEGSIWVGTAHGLHTMHENNVTRYTTVDGLSHNRVFSLYEDSSGILWIGTERGLSIFDGERFFPFNRNHNLIEHAIFAIIEDSVGYLWLSTNSGIYRAERAELISLANGIKDFVRIDHFGTADGLNTTQCNGTSQPAGWKAKDGRLWFPTAIGIAVIQPTNIRINTVPPLVAIEEFVVDGQHIPLSWSDEVTVPPGARRFEIRYAGLSLMAPEMISFRFRLEGNDETWVDVGQRRVAYYTNLKPDSYTFEVHAANNDSIWSENGAMFRFTNLPHFYQTSWFIVGIGLLCAVLIAGSYRWRVSQLRQRARMLEQLVSKRTKGLRSYANELETLDHIVRIVGSEIEFDNLIQALIEQGVRLFPNTEKAVALIRKPQTDTLFSMAMFGWESDLFSDRAFSAEKIMEAVTKSADVGEEGGYLLGGMDQHPLSDNTVTLPIPLASLAMVFILDERCEAVFIFDSFTAEDAFDESDMRKLSRYRRHAVSALGKARIVQQLRETSDKLIKANRELHLISSRDGLTGVANRRYLDEMIDIEWQRARRMKTETAFLMIDIDYFKRYNDEFGHQRGDDCLKAVARVLERGVDRSADFVARYGGEEFVILLPATGLEGAIVVAERLRVAVESLDIRHPTSGVSDVVTVSIGVASISYSSDETLESLIETADRALYTAKQHGRNRVCKAV